MLNVIVVVLEVNHLLMVPFNQKDVMKMLLQLGICDTLNGLVRGVE